MHMGTRVACWLGLVAAVVSATLLAPSAALAACPARGSDAGAKEVARSAQTSAETYATDHHGLYTGLSPARAQAEGGTNRREAEEFLPTTRRQATRTHREAFLYAAIAIEHGAGYILRARAFDGSAYSITRTRNGEIRRTSRRCGRWQTW